MSEDLSAILGKLMQNPDAIRGLMNSLSSGKEEGNTPESNTGLPAMPALSGFPDDRRITLLNAIRPYMSPSRAGGIDRAIQLIRLTRISEAIRNERK